MTDQPEQLALIFRVVEWATWMEANKDPQFTKVSAIQGETGIEIEEGERLADLDVMTVHQAQRHIPIPANGDQPAHNQLVMPVVFRATLAKTVRGQIPDDKMVTETPKVILPGESRSQRRKK